MDPKGWNLEKLKNWLSQVLTQEDDTFDLKEKLPSDEEGRCRLRKEFCGFANGKGGYIFFGIDNNKKIIGVSDNDKEFTTKLSQIITSNVFPPTINWQLYECITMEGNSYSVYIIKIFESLYFHKPHVFFKEGKGLFIPLRENGHLRNITDGGEIRRIFLNSDGYYPEYNVHVIGILKDLKRRTTKIFNLLEANIIQGFKAYLRINGTDVAKEIILALERIEKKVADYNIAFHSNVVEGGVANDGLDITDLEKEIDDFIDKHGVLNI